MVKEFSNACGKGMMDLKRIIIILMSLGLLGMFLTGCGRPHTTPAYPYPSNVTWNDGNYASGKFLKNNQVGHKLGFAKDEEGEKFPAYSMKGYKPNNVIIIEVEIPNKTYIECKINNKK